MPQIGRAIFEAMMPLYPTGTRVLDLFAGAAGGWSLAARWAGLEVVGACELDPWRRGVLADRYGLLRPLA